jgi:hypothetical protein
VISLSGRVGRGTLVLLASISIALGSLQGAYTGLGAGVKDEGDDAGRAVQVKIFEFPCICLLMRQLVSILCAKDFHSLSVLGRSGT